MQIVGSGYTQSQKIKSKKKTDQDWVWFDKIDFNEQEETENLNRKTKLKITLSKKLQAEVQDLLKTGTLSQQIDTKLIEYEKEKQHAKETRQVRRQLEEERRQEEEAKRQEIESQQQKVKTKQKSTKKKKRRGTVPKGEQNKLEVESVGTVEIASNASYMVVQAPAEQDEASECTDFNGLETKSDQASIQNVTPKRTKQPQGGASKGKLNAKRGMNLEVEVEAIEEFHQELETELMASVLGSSMKSESVNSISQSSTTPGILQLNEQKSLASQIEEKMPFFSKKKQTQKQPPQKLEGKRRISKQKKKEISVTVAELESDREGPLQDREQQRQSDSLSEPDDSPPEFQAASEGSAEESEVESLPQTIRNKHVEKKKPIRRPSSAMLRSKPKRKQTTRGLPDANNKKEIDLSEEDDSEEIQDTMTENNFPINLRQNQATSVKSMFQPKAFQKGHEVNLEVTDSENNRSQLSALKNTTSMKQNSRLGGVQISRMQKASAMHNRYSSAGGEHSSLNMSTSMYNRFNSTLLKNFSEPEAIKAILDDALAKRTKHLDKAHQVELRNVKNVCLKEIVSIVRKHTDESSKQLTNEFHKLLKQFIGFKDRTVSYLEKMDEWHMRLVEAELRAAQKNPVNEIMYALDDFCENEALSLYNCAVPQIKAHSVQWGNVTRSYEQSGIRKEILIQNLVSMDQAAEEKMYNPTLLKYKNKVLKLTLDSYKEQLSIVDWYIATMELGINTKNLQQEYMELKEQHQVMMNEHQIYKDQAEKDLQEKKNRIQELKQALKKQQEEVIKPLVLEAKVQHELLERQKRQIEQLSKDLSMMHSIVRLPAMCDQFTKALSRRESKDKLKRLQNEAISHLRGFITEKNENKFFDDFVGRLQTDLFSRNLLASSESEALTTTNRDVASVNVSTSKFKPQLVSMTRTIDSASQVNSTKHRQFSPQRFSLSPQEHQKINFNSASSLQDSQEFFSQHSGSHQLVPVNHGASVAHPIAVTNFDKTSKALTSRVPKRRNSANVTLQYINQNIFTENRQVIFQKTRNSMKPTLEHLLDSIGHQQDEHSVIKEEEHTEVRKVSRQPISAQKVGARQLRQATKSTVSHRKQGQSEQRYTTPKQIPNQMRIHVQTTINSNRSVLSKQSLSCKNQTSVKVQGGRFHNRAITIKPLYNTKPEDKVSNRRQSKPTASNGIGQMRHLISQRPEGDWKKIQKIRQQNFQKDLQQQLTFILFTQTLLDSWCQDMSQSHQLC